jgi:hypothetical protein
MRAPAFGRIGHGAPTRMCATAADRDADSASKDAAR